MKISQLSLNLQMLTLQTHNYNFLCFVAFIFGYFIGLVVGFGCVRLLKSKLMCKNYK